MNHDWGKVTGLRRFPVKSMLGEICQHLQVNRDGAAGDRCCAILDSASGKIASAKRPTPWRALLKMQARLEGALVEITTADGTRMMSDDPDCDTKLSAVLGRPVRLIDRHDQAFLIDRADPDDVANLGVEGDVNLVPLTIGQAMPPGAGFADFAPIHLLSTASLAAVDSVAGPAEAMRFRANLLIDNGTESPFSERNWIGKSLMVGDTLVLRIIEPTPRCAIPTLSHGQLPTNPTLTQMIGKLNKQAMTGMEPMACLGAYAVVEHPGPVVTGDVVRWLT